MSRRVTALLAAFEAAIVAMVGIAIPLVPLTVLWGFHFQLGIDWTAFWRGAADIWLVGHGTDLTLQLHPDLAIALGVPDAAPFVISIAALGLGMITLLLAIRTGRRVASTRYRMLGESVALGTFAALALGVTLSADYPYASPSLWQGILLPTLVFGIGLLIGSTRERLRNPLPDHGSSLRDWISDWPAPLRTCVAAALRGGAGAAIAVIAVAAVVTGIALIAGYAQVIHLYESVQANVLGGTVITLGQLALLPNVIIWTASWLVGPGFAIGTGSSIGPLGTTLGPIPAVPMLGALPTGEHAWGLLGVLVPVILGFLAGLASGRSLHTLDWPWRVGTGVGTGVIAGALLGLLAWASAGSAGPGRLATVGPDPFAVAAWAAVEIAVAATLGALAASIDLSRVKERVTVG
ncbi:MULTISPECIES: DUF6350 family protein [unclassified Diaminobutyricimonas]|uniref:cell division protein PerM n=1 Tax=unclassified Diaminobutyricimonas TaxID=2643261 RepID=UPI0012F4EB8A|nr:MULTISPECIES: DUF6350 family protein [unclassified Diaminobutyricimonas]